MVGLDSGQAHRVYNAYRATEGVFEVLDLGAGNGERHDELEQILEDLGDREIKITALDIRSKALEENGEGVKYDARLNSEGSDYHLPFQDESFDLVYSSHLFCQENISGRDAENIQKAAERLLQDGGAQYHEI